MGPATPSRLALNEASWSGTPRSAGYEWTSEPAARAIARLTPACPKRRTPKSLAGSPHTSRAQRRCRQARAPCAKPQEVLGHLRLERRADHLEQAEVVEAHAQPRLGSLEPESRATTADSARELPTLAPDEGWNRAVLRHSATEITHLLVSEEIEARLERAGWLDHN